MYRNKNQQLFDPIVQRFKKRILSLAIDLFAEGKMPRKTAFALLTTVFAEIYSMLGDLVDIYPELKILQLMIVSFQESKKEFASSEHLLFKYLVQHKYMCQFETVTLRKSQRFLDKNNEVVPVNEEDKLLFVTARQAYSMIFNQTNLLEQILARISELREDHGEIENVMQGRLWHSLISGLCVKDDQIALPLFLFYDEVQLLNSLGSHSTDYKLGVYLMKLGVLPKHLESSLKMVHLHSLFFAGDRKTYGNRNLLSHLVNDMNDVCFKGIDIHHDKYKKVFLVPVMFIGDNDGLNGLFDFSTAFGSGKIICRKCKIERSAFISKHIYILK